MNGGGSELLLWLLLLQRRLWGLLLGGATVTAGLRECSRGGVCNRDVWREGGRVCGLAGLPLPAKEGHASEERNGGRVNRVPSCASTRSAFASSASSASSSPVVVLVQVGRREQDPLPSLTRARRREARHYFLDLTDTRRIALSVLPKNYNNNIIILYRII